MNGFLDRLSARAVGEASLVHPRVRSRFEPDTGELPPEAPFDPQEVLPGNPRETADTSGDAPEERSRLRPAPLPLAPSPIPSPSPGRGGTSPNPTPLDLDTTAPTAFPLSRMVGGDGRGDRGVRDHDAPQPAEPLEAAERSAPPPARIADRRRLTSALADELPTVEPDRRAPVLPPVEESEPSESVVHVSIGRIDVRASQPPAPERRPARLDGPRLSLADYLKRREERR